MKQHLVLAILAILAPACGGGGKDAAPPAPGSLVTGFGVGGLQTSNPSVSSDTLHASAMSADAVFLAGIEIVSGVPDTRWHIEKRSSSDGSLVAAFGTAGAVKSDPSGFVDNPNAVVVDPAGGALFVAGSHALSASDAQWRIEKRDLTTGALVAAFGTAGVVSVDMTTGHEEARALAIDATGLYVAGTDRSAGATNAAWRIMKFNLTTGAAIGAFGTVTSNPSAGDDVPNTLVLSGGFLLAGGTDAVPGNDRVRIEKRDSATGAVDAGFGTAGVVTFDTASNDVLHTLETDGTGIYAYSASNFLSPRIQKFAFLDGGVVGAFGTAGTLNLTFGFPQSIVPITLGFILSGTTLYAGGRSVANSIQVEARDTTTGALITGFGTGGVVTSDPTGSTESALQLELDAGAIYILGDVLAADRSWLIEKRVR